MTAPAPGPRVTVIDPRRGWAVLQSLLTMVVFSFFLGRLAKMPSDGLPYPIFTFAALVPWTFFAHGLTMTRPCPAPHCLLSRRSKIEAACVPALGSV